VNNSTAVHDPERDMRRTSYGPAGLPEILELSARQKECTSSPGGGISAAPCGSCACAIASGLKLSRNNLISPASATR
jgi:hypothetical protein